MGLWALGGGAVAGAQTVTVTGAVTIGYADPRPLAGATVILHRVTMLVQGPIDSTRLDVHGRYRLRIRQVDSAATYLVSVLHEGVGYFSQPIRPTAILGAAGPVVDTLRVYDTAMGGPPLAVQRRLVSIASPKSDGSRDVLEVQELANPGERTRIAADTTHPVWSALLPAGALQFSVGQGDFSSDAVARRGDTVALYGAVQPGGARQLSYGYVIPRSGRSWMLPVDHPLDLMMLLVEDTTARVIGPGLRAMGVRALERRHFAEYQLEHLKAGALVSITFPQGPFRIESLIPVVVGAAALALGIVFVRVLRRPAAT